MNKKKEKEIFDKLYKTAKENIHNSYSPYSKFKVSAALLANDGTIYTGINVENSSYGLTMCAERVAIFKAVSEGKKNFEAILLYTENESFIPPCGACRQVMTEFDPDLTIFLTNVYGEYKKMKLSDIFKWNFSL